MSGIKATKAAGYIGENDDLPITPAMQWDRDSAAELEQSEQMDWAAFEQMDWAAKVNPSRRKIIDSVHGDERQVRIALDFDGVLHSYKSGYTGPVPFDPPVEGAQRFCHMLLATGYEIVIFTTRAHPMLEKGPEHYFVEILERGFAGDWVSQENKGLTLGTVAIRAWFKHYGFPEELQTCDITHKKAHADLFVDDRGFRFEGNFDSVLTFIEKNPGCGTWTGAQ